jgi:hypothetical protein
MLNQLFGKQDLGTEGTYVTLACSFTLMFVLNFYMI